MKRYLFLLFGLSVFIVGAAALPTRLRQNVSATGAATVAIGKRPLVEITCTNAAGCPITLATASPTTVYEVTIVCRNALAGAVCTFVYQANVLVVPAAVSLDDQDVMVVGLTSNGWLAKSQANNVPPTAVPPTATPAPTATPTP